MDEAQNSSYGSATLRVVNTHFAFKLQDAAWETQWKRPWTLHVSCAPSGSSKACLIKNYKIRPKQLSVEVKLRLVFLTTTFAVKSGR